MKNNWLVCGLAGGWSEIQSYRPVPLLAQTGIICKSLTAPITGGRRACHSFHCHGFRYLCIAYHSKAIAAKVVEAIRTATFLETVC